jgi:hypothetical protein
MKSLGLEQRYSIAPARFSVSSHTCLTAAAPLAFGSISERRQYH